MFGRKKGKQQQNDTATLNQENRSIEKQPFDERKLRQLFETNTDVSFQSLSFKENEEQPVVFVFCNGLIDKKTMDQVIYERFVDFFRKIGNQRLSEKTVKEHLFVPGLKQLENEKQLIADIFAGKLIVLFEREKLLFSIDISDRPQRKPEDTNTEVQIKGPRDDFIEDLSTNIALVRKRMRTKSLAVKKYELGTRTKTEIAVLYLDDVVNQDILKELDHRLQRIEIDGIYSGMQLKELLSDKPFAFFPIFHYTGRPDFAVQSLLSGRFLIMIDGIAYAIVGPITLPLLLKTGEDLENIYLFNTFERLVRIFGLLIATLAPGFWVALVSFHQNQLPLVFLATVVESEKGVPLPTTVEALLMLSLFEIFREAGLRLPTAIGQTLSVVGGLIIGEAAIRAGLSSPLMIVIIATSSVATYTLVSLSLHGVISLLRFFVVLLVSFFGFFGFFVALYLIVMYMANIQSFGINYLSVPDRFDLSQIIKTFTRLPEAFYKTRPSMLNPKDETRKPRKE